MLTLSIAKEGARMATKTIPPKKTKADPMPMPMPMPPGMPMTPFKTTLPRPKTKKGGK